MKKRVIFFIEMSLATILKSIDFQRNTNYYFKISLTATLFIFPIISCFAQGDRILEYSKIDFINIEISDSEKKDIDVSFYQLVKIIVANNFELVDSLNNSSNTYLLTTKIVFSDKIEDTILPEQVYIFEIVLTKDNNSIKSVGFFKTRDDLITSFNYRDKFFVEGIKSLFEKGLTM